MSFLSRFTRFLTPIRLEDTPEHDAEEIHQDWLRQEAVEQLPTPVSNSLRTHDESVEA